LHRRKKERKNKNEKKEKKKRYINQYSLSLSWDSLFIYKTEVSGRIQFFQLPMLSKPNATLVLFSSTSSSSFFFLFFLFFCFAFICSVIDKYGTVDRH